MKTYFRSDKNLDMKLKKLFDSIDKIDLNDDFDVEKIDPDMKFSPGKDFDIGRDVLSEVEIF